MFKQIKNAAVAVYDGACELASGARDLAAKTLVAGTLAVGTAVSYAQTATDPFDTAMTTATTKVGAYAAALVGLAAVSVVFMIGIKYVKKIVRAS